MNKLIMGLCLKRLPNLKIVKKSRATALYIIAAPALWATKSLAWEDSQISTILTKKCPEIAEIIANRVS